MAAAAILDLHFWRNISVANKDICLKFGSPIYPTFDKIKNGSSSHLGFAFLRHISVTNEDICLKFGSPIHNRG